MNNVIKPALSVIEPVSVFQGCNSVTGAGLSTAVNGDPVNGSGETSVAINVSTSFVQLAQSLNVDVALSVLSAEGQSGNSTTNFLSTVNKSTYNVYVSVSARKIDKVITATNVQFSDGITIPTDDDSANKFVQQYGDSYVAKQIIGGEYIALYVFMAETVTDQTKIVESLSAQGITSGTSLSGSVQSGLDTVVSSSSVEFDILQHETGVSKVSYPADASGIIDYALKFPSLDLDAPVCVEQEFSGYETVPGGMPAFAKVKQNRDYFLDPSASGGVLQDLEALADINGQISNINEIYKFYSYKDDTKLSERLTSVQNDIDTIRNQVNSFGSNASGEFTLPSLPSLAFGAPVIQFSTTQTNGWGGLGGGNFDDVPQPRKYVFDRTMISLLELFSGGYVNGIRTTYLSGKGVQTCCHNGATGGVPSTSQDFSVPRSIVKVSGGAGKYLDGIVFTLTDGSTLSCGGATGAPYSLTLPENSFLMGFSGACGSCIDSLKVHYCTFSPAIWPNEQS